MWRRVTGNVEGSLEIPFNQTSFKIKPETIYTEVKSFIKKELYLLTGCVHKAMIYLLDGTTVTAEDIGRHNAIDKAIGKCKLQGLDTTQSILFVSGRLSSEMVYKSSYAQNSNCCFKNCTNSFRSTNST